MTHQRVYGGGGGRGLAAAEVGASERLTHCRLLLQVAPPRMDMTLAELQEMASRQQQQIDAQQQLLASKVEEGAELLWFYLNKERNPGVRTAQVRVSINHNWL